MNEKSMFDMVNVTSDVNPIQDGGTKKAPYNFSPVTSTNVGTSP